MLLLGRPDWRVSLDAEPSDLPGRFYSVHLISGWARRALCAAS
jgi:hypothetical protein